MRDDEKEQNSKTALLADATHKTTHDGKNTQSRKAFRSAKMLWAGTSLDITHKRQRRIEDWFPN
jgi:hypothetical protein